MGGLTGLFADRLVSRTKGAKNGLIRLPKITESSTMTIRQRDTRPQPPAAFFAPVANVIGDHLTGAATHCFSRKLYLFWAISQYLYTTQVAVKQVVAWNAAKYPLGPVYYRNV